MVVALVCGFVVLIVDLFVSDVELFGVGNVWFACLEFDFLGLDFVLLCCVYIYGS